MFKHFPVEFLPTLNPPLRLSDEIFFVVQRNILCDDDFVRHCFVRLFFHFCIWRAVYRTLKNLKISKKPWNETLWSLKSWNCIYFVFLISLYWHDIIISGKFLAFWFLTESLDFFTRRKPWKYLVDNLCMSHRTMKLINFHCHFRFYVT